MADYIDWQSQSGSTYRYWLITLTAEAIQAVAGNYMFVKKLANGNFLPVYIGQADNLRVRLPSHERWDDAVRAGAMHAMAHTTPTGEKARLAEERDLIQYWKPMLNTHHQKAS
jgi:hypothetical protein